LSLRLAFPRLFVPLRVGRRCRPKRRVGVGACAQDLGDPVVRKPLCLGVSVARVRRVDRSV